MGSVTRVILIEGLCGSGKSTLGAALCARLPLAVFFDEGAYPHPVSLN